jgi:hypothetical protein
MTDSTKTLIAALLDRSGSMRSIADDMRGGFESFIAAERGQQGTTLVTLVQFDDRYDVVYRNPQIGSVPSLELEPRGTTALLDALGRFVTEVGADLAVLPEDERPGEVTVLVMTDGHERQQGVDRREGTGADRPAGVGVSVGLRVPRRQHGRRPGGSESGLRAGQVAHV